jgi:hypothetical protein
VQLEYQGVPLDLAPPFRRAAMAELVREACGLELEVPIAVRPGVGGICQ